LTPPHGGGGEGEGGGGEGEGEGGGGGEGVQLVQRSSVVQYEA